MDHIFTSAIQYYDDFPFPYTPNPAREEALAHLIHVLENVTVLNHIQKDGMQRVARFFSTDVLQGLKESLIRENLRDLHKRHKSAIME